jgi:hypothetical protein
MDIMSKEMEQPSNSVAEMRAKCHVIVKAMMNDILYTSYRVEKEHKPNEEQDLNTLYSHLKGVLKGITDDIEPFKAVLKPFTEKLIRLDRLYDLKLIDEPHAKSKYDNLFFSELDGKMTADLTTALLQKYPNLLDNMYHSK